MSGFAHITPMHVLMFSWEYPPHLLGGLGTHVADLLPALTRQHWAITLLTPQLRGGAAEEWLPNHADQVRVVRVATAHPNVGDFPTYVEHVNHDLRDAALSLAATTRFDVIHAHDWMVAPAALELHRSTHLPLVATIHATERGRGRGSLPTGAAHRIDWWERELVAQAQRIIVCSHAMLAEVVESLQAVPERIEVIPNAVYIRPDPFPSPAERLVFRRHYAPDHEPLVFNIGRVVEEKGVHVLIDAWAQVCRELRAKLVMAGSGPSLDNCRAHAAHLGLDRQIILPGRISDDERDRLYRVAQAAVFPSLYEPFGIVALEAQAAHCPVVVTATGGLFETVRPHETGIVVQPNDAASLAWGLLHTLHHPDWAQQRAANALHDLHRIYNWERAAQMTAGVYQQAIAHPLPTGHSDTPRTALFSSAA